MSKNDIDITKHLKFVHMVACHYAYSGIPHEDLYSEGVLGLIEAGKRYDPSKNIKFISFAVWWIRNVIIKYIAANSRAVYIPPKVNLINIKVQKEIERLEQEKQRNITESDIKIKRYNFPTKISFDSYSTIDKKATLLDCFNDQHYNGDEYSYSLTPEREMYDHILTIAKRYLNKQQKNIFLSYFVDCDTLDICGKINGGVSKERARQILKEAIKIIKKYIAIEEDLCAKEKK
jgi:RNA polymerase primary sigma factor